jgi:hypothetical protein
MPEVPLPDSLLGRLAVERAAAAEAAEPRTTLPSRVAEAVVSDHAPEYAQYVEATAARGVETSPQEVVWVCKSRTGRYRAVQMLPFLERVLLRALTLDIVEDAPDPDRTQEARERFEREVLEYRDANYIVVSDVSSFYFYIDHDLLERRIVESTARADTARAIRSLLGAVTNFGYGLPQTFRPSDPLSELVIDPVERALLRRGLTTHRFNDDFRLAGESWGAALQALELLHSELRRVGLTANDEKTWILKRETYENNLGLVDRYLSEAFAAISGDGLTFHPYTGEPIEVSPEGESQGPSEEDILEAVKVAFDEAANRREAGEALTGQAAAANRQILTIGFFAFQRARDPHGLHHGPALLVLDPSLAHQYANYLRTLVQQGVDVVQAVADVGTAFRGRIPDWAMAWMMNALLDIDLDMNEETTTKVRRFLESTAPAVLRARAALVLALHGKISAIELTQLFNEAPTVARPDIAAALGLLPGPATNVRETEAAVRDDRISKWAFEKAAELYPTTAWL